MKVTTPIQHTQKSAIDTIYGKICKNLIKKEYDDIEVEVQAGFRVGKSTIKYLFSLSLTLEKKTARM